MEISRIEFDDKDDTDSKTKGIRFTIAPEAMVVALPNGKLLGSEDQKVFGQILRLSYEQGKRVGKQLSGKQ